MADDGRDLRQGGSPEPPGPAGPPAAPVLAAVPDAPGWPAPGPRAPTASAGRRSRPVAVLAAAVLGIEVVVVLARLLTPGGDSSGPRAYMAGALIGALAMGLGVGWVATRVRPGSRSRNIAVVLWVAAFWVGASLGQAGSMAAARIAAADDSPAEWPDFSREGVDWRMPRDPRITEAPTGWTYLRSASLPGGGLDPCKAYVVSISQPSAVPFTSAGIAATAAEHFKEQGWVLTRTDPTPAGEVGYEAEYFVQAGGCGVPARVRVVAFGGVLVTAVTLGDLGDAGAAFLGSFVPDGRGPASTAHG